MSAFVRPRMQLLAVTVGGLRGGLATAVFHLRLRLAQTNGVSRNSSIPISSRNSEQTVAANEAAATASSCSVCGRLIHRIRRCDSLRPRRSREDSCKIAGGSLPLQGREQAVLLAN